MSKAPLNHDLLQSLTCDCTDCACTGLGIANQLPIKVEASLFEWLTWYQTGVPEWMSEDELVEAGFKIDTQYQPLISREQLNEHMDESCSQYYNRNYQFLQHILKENEDKGT